MRVALVHDWLTGMRGGEWVLYDIARLFPDAPIYTLVHRTGSVAPLLEEHTIRTSWLQAASFGGRRWRHLLPLMPAAAESFAFPEINDMISSINRSDLLYNAFHFIPGKHYHFEVLKNGEKIESFWEINTDPYNNSYIRCHQSGAMAYFINDGNLVYFTHFTGNKKSLLYYFFLAAFQVQQGFYQDLTISDRYPLNLIFNQPLLGLQDLVAPFWKFLRSEFQCKYDWIDNDMSPSEIRLVSSATNSLAGKALRRFDFSITVNDKGIHKLTVETEDLQLEATCIE